MSRLAKAGHQPTIDAALAKFNDHFENNVDLHPDLRGMIYGVVARNTGKDGIEKLRKIFETCGFSEVERNCIVALGQAIDENLLEDVFKYGVTEGKIRSQDYMSLVSQFFVFLASYKIIISLLERVRKRWARNLHGTISRVT